MSLATNKWYNCWIFIILQPIVPVEGYKESEGICHQYKEVDNIEICMYMCSCAHVWKLLLIEWAINIIFLHVSPNNSCTEVLEKDSMWIHWFSSSLLQLLLLNLKDLPSSSNVDGYNCVSICVVCSKASVFIINSLPCLALFFCCWYC